MAHFEIRDLTFSYAGAAGVRSLDHVSLRIEPGEYVLVCGASGSGKTTLFRHLRTALTPNGQRSGEILFCGTPLSQVGLREQTQGIGYVMQNPDDQIVTDKVWHELAFGLESLGTDQKTMRARVAEMACYFGIQDWFHRDVAELSGGQKQLLNLASVMAMQPQVLVLDEPTSQLDPIAAADFLNTVRKINLELGTTVLICEHRLEDIFPHADRVVVMDGGRVLADDTPRAVARLLWEREHPMFSALPAPVRVFYAMQAQEPCPLTVREGRSRLSRIFPNGTAAEDIPALAQEEAEDPVLSARELWFRYEKDSPDILRGMTLHVQRGTLHAIVGGNGAGKSTALKAICGICRPYRGKIKILGKPVEKYRGAELFRGCLAMLPQDPKSLFVSKSVREELEEMTGDAEKIDRIAALCRIASLMQRHPYDLSGGEQQRVALAKVLLTEPKILLLDEPTKGIDSFFKEELARLLGDLRAQGATVILVSHDVEFCARHADRVSMFFDGQILTTDTPRRFFGGNSFYTTAANRMSRHVMHMAVTAEDVVRIYRENPHA